MAERFGKTGGSVGMETGNFGLVERFLLFRARWAKVGEIGDDWGVRRRTKVDMGISVSE